MRISDWSSDVCSSDLRLPAALANALANLCVTLRQDVGNDKIGATVREPERASTRYSAAAARDDSNLAGQNDPGPGHEVGSPVGGGSAGRGPKPGGGRGEHQRRGPSPVLLTTRQPHDVRDIFTSNQKSGE